jgi:hypothetical protein
VAVLAVHLQPAWAWACGTSYGQMQTGQNAGCSSGCSCCAHATSVPTLSERCSSSANKHSKLQQAPLTGAGYINNQQVYSARCLHCHFVVAGIPTTPPAVKRPTSTARSLRHTFRSEQQQRPCPAGPLSRAAQPPQCCGTPPGRARRTRQGVLWQACTRMPMIRSRDVGGVLEVD